jgi:serine phosphatase RsbU (regulator of sigma subunit)
MKIRIALIIFFQAFGVYIWAQPMIRYSYPIEFRVDSSFTPEQIVDLKFFKKTEVTKGQFFWIKFELENLEPIPNDFFISLGKIDWVEIYEYRVGYLEKIGDAGVELPYNKRSATLLSWTETGFFASFPPSGRRMFFLKIKDNNFNPEIFWPNLIDVVSYNRKVKRVGLISGLYFGFFIINAILFTVLGIFSARKTYIFYGITSAFAVLAYLSNYGYTRAIWGTMQNDYLHWLIFSQGLAAFYILFTRESIESKTQFKEFDWILILLVVLRVLMIAFGLFFVILFDKREAIRISVAVLDLANLIIGTYILIKVYPKGNVFIKYLLLGTAVLMVGLLLGVMSAFGLILLPEHISYLQISFLLQFCILSVGLGWQTRDKLKEDLRNQQAIIELKTKTAEKLEAQVQERTKELVESNNLIKLKNDELKANEEELRQNMEELQVTQESLQAKKLQLEEKNIAVTQSIRYAQTIQNTILPLEEKMKQLLGDYFVIYQPRDIVSGDFYWVWQKENLRVVVLADCTGHGVPGAFMTLIGHNLLEQIVNSQKTPCPNEIIQKLHVGIRNRLNQAKTKNNDGMDVAVCMIEAQGDGLKVWFSGAKNRMYRSHEGQISEYRGDRHSIGGNFYGSDLTFSQCEFEAQKGEILYLLSDGMPDQANDARKSYSFQRFKELLIEIQDQPLDHQKQLILLSLAQHQGHQEQRDDITILGWRL